MSEHCEYAMNLILTVQDPKHSSRKRNLHFANVDSLSRRDRNSDRLSNRENRLPWFYFDNFQNIWMHYSSMKHICLFHSSIHLLSFAGTNHWDDLQLGRVVVYILVFIVNHSGWRHSLLLNAIKKPERKSSSIWQIPCQQSLDLCPVHLQIVCTELTVAVLKENENENEYR